MNAQRIAFFGLGTMGSGMVRRLLQAGFPVTVYNRTPERARTVGELGATIAPSARAAAEGGEVLISMVADDVASRNIWLGDEGALKRVSGGKLLIESSTLTVSWVRELAQLASALGCPLLDAPVTGSKTQAASGELNFLVGGPERALQDARPILAVMSRTIIHVGPSGSGALLKLINNFLCGVQVASLAEAMAWMEQGGLNRLQTVEFLKNAAPGSPLIKVLADRMSARDYTPNFQLQLMLKDLKYALEEAGQHELQLTTAAAASQVFERAMKLGRGGQDMSAIVEQFRTGAS